MEVSGQLNARRKTEGLGTLANAIEIVLSRCRAARLWKLERTFAPPSRQEREREYAGWKRAVAAVLHVVGA